MIYYHFHRFDIGELLLADYQNQLVICDWRYRKSSQSIIDRICRSLDEELEEKSTALIQNTITQLQEYFDQKRTTFDIPLKLVGSDFQKTVWTELLQIPYGKTLSYLDLSRQLQNEKAIRAVASANGANALAIIVPCHRIIGSTGELVGYAGGLGIKKKLLQLEGAAIYNQGSFEF